MNDPGPYRTTFSDLAKSTSAQDEFFESLITFMQKYNFDGVDIDWEYPWAEDRGGIPADFDNFVNFLRRLRERLNSTGRTYGLSITLVCFHCTIHNMFTDKSLACLILVS